MKLPFELRDLIYRMLLTTPYCTSAHPTSRKTYLKFNLQTEILLVNRQISAEAMRILYRRNDFVIFKITGFNLDLDLVPRFRFPSGHRIPSPILRIDLKIADGLHLRTPFAYQGTLLTTIEGLQPIINAIWRLKYSQNPPFYTLRYPYSSPKIHHADLSLTLDFNLNIETRYQTLSDRVLKPWDKVSGLKELVLKGDIKKPMRDHLEKYIFEGPFPCEVAASLTEYHSRAEQSFEQKYYNACRWWWAILEEYWNYLLELRPYRLEGHLMCQKGNELWGALAELVPMYFEGKLNLVIACFRLLKYEQAVQCAQDVIDAVDQRLGGWAVGFGYELTPTMHATFQMSVRMLGVALGSSSTERDLFTRFLGSIIGAHTSN
jgi:hypothetical protein